MAGAIRLKISKQKVTSRKGRHIIAGIAWVIGSLVAWTIVCNVFSFVVFMCLGNQR